MTQAVEADEAGGEDRHRYRRLMSVLRRRIAGGDYPVGSQLPTEGELCAEFAVSRYTVREALRRLVDLGMVERRQGSGSQVVSAEPRQRYVQSMRSLSELFQYALDTRLDVISAREERMDGEEAELLSVPRGEAWYAVRGIRRMPDRPDPICFVSAFVPARLAAPEAEILATRGPIYAVAERRAGVPIAETVQDVSAAPMPPDVRRALGLRPPAFALRFVRRYLAADGRLLTASVNWHPAEGFSYRTTIRRTPGAEP